MPWNRPTLKQLYERIARDISGHLLEGKDLLFTSVLSVLAKVWAGACHMMHSLLAWIFLQVFIDTAEGENLRRWARVWKIIAVSAKNAVGLATVSGVAGAVLPASTQLVSKQGIFYTTLADAVLHDGLAQVLAQAVVPGLAGNMQIGEELTLVEPLAAIDSALIVSGEGLIGGVDDEDDESLRARLLERLRKPPRGGNKDDYVAWVREVVPDAKVYVDPLNQGPGTVGICFTTTQQPTPPFPSAEMVQKVQTHINAVCPVPAEVFVFAPRRQDVILRLAVLPNTVAVRTAVSAAVNSLCERVAYPGCTIPQSHTSAAISLAEGEDDHAIISPVGPIVMPPFTYPIVTVEFEDMPV